MNDRKQLNKDLKRTLAEYKISGSYTDLKKAQKLLAALGRSTKELIRESEKQQTKLF